MTQRPHTAQERHEIKECIRALQQGNLILYPTDTVWGIGCDATNAAAVQKVYDLKQRANSKALICLVADYAMLERHVTQVPQAARAIIDKATKPTTLIFDQPLGVAPNLVAADNTLALRVASDAFCQHLICSFGKPIVSTSANISGAPTPKQFAQISPKILKGVAYVVHLYQEIVNPSPSTILKLTQDGQVTVIRE